MPGFETLDLLQRAILWNFVRTRGDGEPIIASPVEIPVRWTDQLAHTLDPKGETVTVDATAVVALDIPIGSIMWLGSLQDFPGAISNPDLGTGFEPEGVPWPSGLMMVKTLGRGSDLKNRFVRRTVGLLRWNQGLPQIGS